MAMVAKAAVLLYETQPRRERKDDEARGRVAAPHGHELAGGRRGLPRPPMLPPTTSLSLQPPASLPKMPPLPMTPLLPMMPSLPLLPRSPAPLLPLPVMSQMPASDEPNAGLGGGGVGRR